jgi:hypothetical protein
MGGHGRRIQKSLKERKYSSTEKPRNIQQLD